MFKFFLHQRKNEPQTRTNLKFKVRFILNKDWLEIAFISNTTLKILL